MNEESIDKSCWLPKGEELEIRLSLKILLNFLLDEQIITEEQWHDACIFQVWQAAHRVALGLQKPVSLGTPNDYEQKLRAHGYSLLIRKLPKSDIQAIEKCYETYIDSHLEFMACNHKSYYRNIFERLSEAFKLVREKIEYLQNLGEVGIKEFEEENLKNYLQNIRKSEKYNQRVICCAQN